MGAHKGEGGGHRLCDSTVGGGGGHMEKSAKSTLKVRKKTRVFIGKLVVGVALCDKSNNKSNSLYVTRDIPCK